MHELSIAMNIVELAAAEACKHAGARVRAVHVRVGPLSGVVPLALRSAFELARTDSPLEQAELVIEEVPLVTHCPTCAADRSPEHPALLCCPVCGQPTPEVVSGRELDLVSLEIES